MGVLDSTIKSWHCCPLNRFNRSGISRVPNFHRWWIDDSTLTACDVLVVIKNWGAKFQSFEPVLPKLPTKPSWRLETLPCFDNFSHSNLIYFGFSHLDSPLLMIFPYIPIKNWTSMAGRCCSALAAVSPRQRTGQAETSRVSGRRALEIYSNPPKKRMQKMVKSKVTMQT